MVDDDDQRTQNELDPLLQCDVKVPTKQEANMRVQFLALCWGMFVMGWTNSSTRTGPLLPEFRLYDVSSLRWPIRHPFDYFSTSLFFRSVRSSVLGICFTADGQ